MGPDEQRRISAFNTPTPPPFPHSNIAAAAAKFELAPTRRHLSIPLLKWRRRGAERLLIARAKRSPFAARNLAGNIARWMRTLGAATLLKAQDYTDWVGTRCCSAAR